MKFVLEEGLTKLSEDIFDFDENSKEDQGLYDAISTYLADKFCPAFGIDIEVVSQFSRFEDIMDSLIRMVKQGRSYKQDALKENSRVVKFLPVNDIKDHDMTDKLCQCLYKANIKYEDAGKDSLGNYFVTIIAKDTEEFHKAQSIIENCGFFKKWIQESISEDLRLSLEEDFSSSFPNWILSALNLKYSDLKSDLLKKKIDLANAKFTETYPPQSNRDPILKDPNKLSVFLLDNGNTTEVYVPDGKTNPYVKKTLDSMDWTYANNLSWKEILTRAIAYGYFELDNSSNLSVDKQKARADAHRGSIERGKGQYSYKGFDGAIHWVTAKGEDKSGYKLDPQKYTKMLDNVNLNNYSDRLDDYYNKIEKVRSDIIEVLQSVDLHNKDYLSKGSFSSGRVTGDISDAIRDLDQAIYYYRDLCTGVERIISKPDRYTDDHYTINDAIKNVFRFNSNSVREYLKDASKIVAHIKSNPIRPKVED